VQLDGLLVVDKPAGPTSHDVVARVRRLLRQRQVGHTGTLDPLATGVLAIVVGRATRLARFVASGPKHYTAVVRLGFSTDTYDATGHPVGEPWTGVFPDAEAIDQALNAFRGTFLQSPPAYSAKRVGGKRSYRLARRRDRRALESTVAPADENGVAIPAPVAVTAASVVIVNVAGDQVTLQIACSPGFYVRALAHDLGQALGTGAHLAALRRTGSGGLTLDDAVTLATLEAEGVDAARAALIPTDRMLLSMPGVRLTETGVARATKGRDLGPADVDKGFPAPDSGGPFRMLDRGGRLVAIGERAAASGLLHPAVVLM
jgi:tRNA pseudouridine55 synthase